jgi:hypothetical protein
MGERPTTPRVGVRDGVSIAVPDTVAESEAKRKRRARRFPEKPRALSNRANRTFRIAEFLLECLGGRVRIAPKKQKNHFRFSQLIEIADNPRRAHFSSQSYQ